MDASSRKKWAERSVLAVTAAFPFVEHANWPQCERILPSVLVVVGRIQQGQMSSPEAAFLLNQVAFYLQERARYQEAEPLYVQALAIREQQLGASHPYTATSRWLLTTLYETQGK